MPRSWMEGAKRALATSLLLLAAGAGIAAAQVSTDVIRGRIVDVESKPIDGVDVKATSYNGQVTKTARTNKSGAFTIIFINGEGDYWIELRKLGFAFKRYEIKKIGDEEVLLANTRLTSVVATIEGITTTAQRDRALPNRNAKDTDVGGGDRALTNALVPPDQAGNLAAMAGAVGFQVIPGLNGAPDMYSVLGLSGDQNNVTFNGLGSGISALPPDVLATTSINAYPFDVAKGGFSGAQITIQTIPGSNFSRRAITSSTIAPALEWADRAAESQGQKFTNARVGGNAVGPIVVDGVFYNTAYNVARRLSDANTLLDASDVGLAAAGVSADSVNRLLRFLNGASIPTDRAGIPASRTQNLAQGLINFDIMPSASGTGHSFTVGAVGNVQQTSPVDRTPLLLSTPGHADATSVWSVNTSLVHTNYFWFGVLSKTTLGFAAQSQSTSPYERQPEGTVRVTSSFADGTSSVRSLSFGGNAFQSASRTGTVQLTNQLSWFSLDNTHTLRVTSTIARDAFRSDGGQRLGGSYTYNSIADLEAGVPASFTRTLSTQANAGDQLAGAIAVGDYWRPVPGVQVQYGVRVDGNHFLSTPALNPALADAFDTRTDRLPNRVYASPRVGLQWAYGRSSQVSYAPGSARPPQAVIHAGAGVFQNIAPSTFAAPAFRATGIPGSTRSITCVGPAVPFAAWSSFLTDAGAVPTACADGTTGGVYGSTAASVLAFDRAFREPRAVRAAADWSGPVLDNRFVLGVQGIVSNGLSQQGAVDINVPRASRFTLRDEAGRPVYADPATIVPTTGAIAAGAARASNAFQSVLIERSDLGMRSRQVTINLKPVTASGRLKWDLSYSRTHVREQYYGFSSTAGDPFAKEWGASLITPDHMISLRWSDFPIFDVLYVTMAVQAGSGQRYTPIIAGDVNGDGVLNDRAFITNPAKTADTAMRASMSSLLRAASPSTRACLERQFDRLATRGSCVAPWTVANGMQIKLNPQKLGIPRRATITLTVANPLGLVDLALHGTDDARGWGQRIPPDQSLLYVRGFDLIDRRFRYDVNQRFGSTKPRESAVHTLPYMSLAVSFDLGFPRERQTLTQQMDAGRVRPGGRADAQTLKTLGISTIPNPMAMLLGVERELHLSRWQADSLATLSRSFQVFGDSVWSPAAAYLASLPESYRTGDAYARYVSARERTVDYLILLVPAVEHVLTASQRRQLPAQIANFLDRRTLRFLRSSSAG
jgi:hypothetical protein